jgi:nitrate/TMAO reductase-like tetraheme cytochrome c subunit
MRSLALLLIFISIPPICAYQPANLPEGMLKHAGYSYKCVDCHRILPVDKRERKLLGAHGNIKMMHENLWCYDCHYAGEPSALVDKSGSYMSMSSMNESCGSCHEDVYGKWKSGLHGRQVDGYLKGSAKIESCNQCHDAHEPKIKKRTPVKIPSTRFGAVNIKGGSGIWKRSDHETQ